MALVDVYNVIYEDTDLRSRTAAAIFLKAAYTLNIGTETPTRLLFSEAAKNDPKLYVQDFMPDMAANEDVVYAQTQHVPVGDNIVEYVVGYHFNKIADRKFPPA